MAYVTEWHARDLLQAVEWQNYNTLLGVCFLLKSKKCVYLLLVHQYWEIPASNIIPICNTRGNKQFGSRDSVVGKATGYGMDNRGVGVRVPVGSRIFSSPRRPDEHWGPPSLLSNEYRSLFPRGIKRPGREADNSPPITAEVKKMWTSISTLPNAIMA
jgi:hypothetical protein